ncbi:MAG: riboflavin synthase [Dehalococcoidia bacterium]
MFTGIVEEIGIVKETSRNSMTFEAMKVLEGTKLGDSIAVNGVCLTVISLANRRFSVNVMPETLRRTNLGGLRYNDQVNLERALALGGRIGGHLVLGHIDDTGEVIDVASEQDARILRISVPVKLMPYVIVKGFISVDGVSLTVIDVDDFSFAVSLVAYTIEHTTLGRRRHGDMVNLEADFIPKSLENLKERKTGSLDFEFLREYGFAGGSDAS